MPNVDGHTATTLIREHGYKGPVIALTAFADESNVKKCFESGMDCFLAKPVKRGQVGEMLRLYVRERSENSNRIEAVEEGGK